MKLFCVDDLTIRDGYYTSYLVAENKDIAKDKFVKNYEDICFYQILIDEVDNIDGYKVVFKSDKKISLEYIIGGSYE